MKLLIAFFTLFITFNLSAHSNNDLAEEMKIIESQFKQIATSLQSGQISTMDIEAAETLQKAIVTASLIYPKTADSDSLKLKYSEWMSELTDLALDIEQTMESEVNNDPQDLSASIELFRLMNELRKKGHAEFKDSH